MRIHGAKFFLQDGATSMLVIKKLKEMEGEFKVLDWPVNSPDLNLFEKLVLHETQVEGQEVRDHLPPKADLCHQEDVGG